MEKSLDNLLNINKHTKNEQAATHPDMHLYQNNILLGPMMDALPKINKPLIQLKQRDHEAYYMSYVFC